MDKETIKGTVIFTVVILVLWKIVTLIFPILGAIVASVLPHFVLIGIGVVAYLVFDKWYSGLPDKPKPEEVTKAE